VESTLARRALDVTGSILTTLLIFGATPSVLFVVVGNPLGDGLGRQWSEGPRLLLGALVLVAWIAWAVCCTQLARAVVEQVRCGHAGPPVGAVLTDRVAARIAAGVLSLVAFGSPVALSATAGAAGPHTAGTVGRDAPSATAATAAVAAWPTASATGSPVTTPDTYVVRPGDTLWSIADAALGDGDDWPAIAALNLGRTMVDGLQFVDPNRIFAGWILEMPDQGARVSAAAVSALPLAPGPSEPPGPATHLEAPEHDALVHGAPVNEALVMAHPDSLEAGAAHHNLPELAALGIGALACAALTRRARRIRLLRHVDTEESDPTSFPSPQAIDAGILLARGAGLPALRAFEAANYGLAALLADRSERTVTIRAICVGAAGVDFWLAGAGRPAPDGLTGSPDGLVWHAAHGTFSKIPAGHPLLPIVLPVGEDDHGTWLLPLAPGDCLPLLGEDAAALWRAARPVQEAWSWADTVLVTEDPLVASAEALLRDERAEPGVGAPQVLYFGNPAVLGDAVAQRVAVVTLTEGPASDVTVLVDRRGASIHPLGRTVRPHLMGSATSQLIGELVDRAAPPARNYGPGPGTTVAANDRVPGAPDAPSASAPDPWRPTASATYSAERPVPDAGTVEVRLLTPTPRLEGLRTALPPNRVRRAVELVAYLALHAGEDVTSDRLRTRVLGSSDADAAAKTLFNIATAARRAMGLDTSGAPLFPPGSRTGHYRVSDAVSTDVHRAAGLALAASNSEDPDTAMGLLRAALDLVEGEPMANVLSGYTWWDAEGHGARIAAVLVNAATDLAALAVEAELFELAQWGLEQARLVDPYSEALSRAAMQVAAAAGDADRLRREWRDCQRRMDELDPGSAPSPRTERLYGELAQRVLVGVRTDTDR
jgi:DNA-binding SARP family transcriptional activator